MDQYFIELLLKQQERGNKLNNTFTKQAWAYMLTWFNAQFRSGYNKRVLRHRYKKLCKYYSDLMTLAKQKGFSWDEKQEMVVANAGVWDAYIKGHPHARSYRDKVYPGYNNLALIFRVMINKEIQSDCHQDKDVKIEGLVAKAGSCLSMIFKFEGSEHSRTYWTPPMDRFLIDLMLEQVHRGNRIGQEVLKNRYKHFRKQYNDVRIILQHNGFSWGEGREIVTAEDHVWNAYIKVAFVVSRFLVMEPFSFLIENGREAETYAGEDFVIEWTTPMERYFVDLMLEQNNNLLNQEGLLWDEALQMIIANNDMWVSLLKISYKDKVLGNYKELCTIFGTTESVDQKLICDIEMEFDQHPIDIKIDEYCGDLPVTFLETETCSQEKKQAPPVALESRAKEQKTITISALTKLVNKEAENNYGVIERAIDALQAIPDMDDELLLDNCELLEDERKAKTFLALDVSLTKKWLLRKLGHS
ncbi:hypothetical protein BUALT_Bualt10G0004600 [Buddleja alternifolia]|uniref:Myb/SANT-like domain-containing protein n=1 Tax=Buddleja alternifolia TaxID=168488 RepID=A0AAV6WU64_9LAMI|nr:hypothetical protein BUALT_Bualt10G0004600 [Buddleja alternifolia]